MTTFRYKNLHRSAILPAALALLALAGMSMPAAADDYRFQVKGPAERVDGKSVVTVALIDASSGRPIPNAEVFRRGMTVQTKTPPYSHEQKTSLTPDGQGNYRLVTSSPVRPGTTLKLGAHVPDKSSGVQGLAEVPAATMQGAAGSPATR